MSRIWTQQPQVPVPVGIDWGNPITRGLVLASTNDLDRNIVSGKPQAKVVTTGGATKSASKFGLGQTFSGGTTYGANGNLLGSQFSALFIGNPSNSSAFAYYQTGSSGQLWIGANVNEYGGPTGANFGAGFLQTSVVRGKVTADITHDGNHHVYAVTKTATAGTAYLDGIAKTVSTFGLSAAQSNANDAYEIGGLKTNSSYSFAANLTLLLLWNRALSAAEIKSLSDNSWQIFQPLPSRIFVGPAAAVTNPSGDLAATETDGDTSAFTGIVLVQGTAAATDSGTDTFAATGGAATSTGTLAATETGDDTATSTGTVLVKGALAATDSGSDTSASTGTVRVQGAVAATDSGTDTFAATGGSIVTATGTLNATESGSDTATSSGTILVQGLLAALEAGGDTVYIDGQIYIVGACSATETGSDTFAASSAAVVIPGAPVGGLRDSKTQTSLRAGRIQTSLRAGRIQTGTRNAKI